MRTVQKPIFAMMLLTILFIIGLSVSPYDAGVALYGDDDDDDDGVLLIAVSETQTDINDADTTPQNITFLLEAPKTLPVGEELQVFAVLKNADEGESGVIRWYINDSLFNARTIATGNKIPALNHTFTYSPEMPETANIRAELTYNTQQREEQTLTATCEVAIENYDFDYWFETVAEQIQNKITSEYKGDYTTKYALDNDFSDFEKEVWVNAGEYKSKTEYLIWINLAYQRVNIFERLNNGYDEDDSDSDNNKRWELIRTCLAGTGSTRTPTPHGVFYVNGKQEDGWHLTSYIVRPVVNFSAGVNYAFHSRLYYPGTDELYDPSIGYPVSHGCIRMLDEDIQFIFDNIPVYTTVVVH